MENIQSVVLGWPALMGLETAAQYLSLDTQTFETVAHRYSAFPVIIDSDEPRWRKTDLDRMIRHLPNDSTFKTSGPKVSVVRLEKDNLDELAAIVADKLNSTKPRNTSRLVSIRETAELMGVGRSTIYRLIENGKLVKRKIGRRTLIERDSINQLVGQ